MDIRKVQRELSWEPRENLESGLRKTVEWYLSHSEWIDTIRSEKNYQEWLERNYANRGVSE